MFLTDFRNGRWEIYVVQTSDRWGHAVRCIVGILLGPALTAAGPET